MNRRSFLQILGGAFAALVGSKQPRQIEAEPERYEWKTVQDPTPRHGIYTHDGADWVPIEAPVGTSGQFLQTSGAGKAPTWADSDG